MTIRELIETLSNYDGDAEVLLSTNSMTFKRILEVSDEDYEEGNILYLEG